MEFAELEGKVHVDQHPAVEERCQLDGTVRSVAGDYREQAQQNGIDLEVEVSKEGPVRLDSHLVERVLTHLVDNSVKFTEEGTISVSATAGADAVVLQVDDTGVGIDPDFLPRVFDEFAQASTGLSRRYEGNGLGLTVAKRLVDRAGGDIEIESEAEEGTWVTVRLPTGG
jgi:signal transduction histidine kinase